MEDEEGKVAEQPDRWTWLIISFIPLISLLTAFPPKLTHAYDGNIAISESSPY